MHLKLICLLTSITLCFADLSQGLIAYWNFDSDSGNVLYDQTENKNHGLITDGIWTHGITGSAIRFDSYSGSINCGNRESLSPDSAITLSAMILINKHPFYPDNVENTIISKKSSYKLSMYEGYPKEDPSGIQFSLYANGHITQKGSCAKFVKTKRWYHLIASYSSDTFFIKVNGNTIELDDEFSKAMTGISSSSSDLILGNLIGVLDEIKIYDRALSEDELTELYKEYESKITSLQILTLHYGGKIYKNTKEIIEWRTSGEVPFVNLSYSLDAGRSWIKIQDSVDASQPYEWTVPDTNTLQGRVKITNTLDTNIVTMSYENFYIVDSSYISLKTPSDTLTCKKNAFNSITWASTNELKEVSIAVSIDNKRTWDTLTTNTTNDGEHLWFTPDTLSDSCYITITSVENPEISVTNQKPFRITDEIIPVLHSKVKNNAMGFSIGSLQLPYAENEISTYKIVSLSGKVVFDSKDNHNIHCLPHGIYICNIALRNGQTHNLKLIRN